MRRETLLNYFGASALSFGLAYLFFLAYRNPDRNLATRALQKYLAFFNTRWWHPEPRLRLFVIALVMFVVGCVGTFLGVRELSQP